MKKFKTLIIASTFFLSALPIFTADTFASESLSDGISSSKWGYIASDNELLYLANICENFIYNETINSYFVDSLKIEKVIIDDNHVSEIIDFNYEQNEISSDVTALIGVKIGSVEDNKFITLVCENKVGKNFNNIINNSEGFVAKDIFRIVGYIPSESSSWINVEIINAFLNKTKYEYNSMYNNDIDTIDSFMEETVLLMFANELINIQEYIDFNPYENITRGEVVSILSKYSNEDLSNYISSSFDDVDNNSDYMKHIEWAKNIGIVNGVSTTEFAPNEYITREQLAVILNNYIKYYNLDIWKYERDFADFEEVSTWAVESVKDTILYTGFTKEDESIYFNSKNFASKLDVCFALEQIIYSYII